MCNAKKKEREKLNLTFYYCLCPPLQLKLMNQEMQNPDSISNDISKTTERKIQDTE